ncbi:MAG: NADPH:quinone oxidoreductase family protein [Pseudomonadota bacterium]
MRVHDLEGPDALRCDLLEPPPLAERQVRIAVKAAGLNYPDLLMTRGGYQRRPDLPFAPGMEVSGVVLETGPGVTQVDVGQRVMAMGRSGGFSEQFVAAESATLPLPDGFSDEEGATFCVAGVTAHHALVDKAAISSADTCLIAGASGGVGLAAVQLAKARGARVIALASGDAKQAAVRRAGADHLIDYAADDIREAVRAATDGALATVVYDPVGGELAQTMLRCLGWNGLYLIIGFTSGAPARFETNKLLIKSHRVAGVRAGESHARAPHLAAAAFRELQERAAAGQMTPHVGETFALEDAAAALKRMEARGVVGRLAVLTGS